jgi:hypothetical protein
MKNADMPAMPVITEKRVANTSMSTCDSSGLTKREMFAMNAMQGLLSNSGGVIQGNNYSGTGWCNSDANDLARLSLECADELLKELEK